MSGVSGRRLPDVVRAEVIAMVERGLKQIDVAEELGISKSFVSRILTEEGVTPPRTSPCHRGPTIKVERAQVTCLRCRKSFMSWDRRKNRICVPCSKSADF